MIRRQFLILTVLLLLSPTLVFAQERKPAEDKSGEKVLKEKAYDLLDSLATQISTLQSVENRARIGSNIAASIWTHDEKRARALFIAVGEDIKLGLQQPPDPNPLSEQTSSMVFLHLRENTIDRIAKFDPEFAFDFLVSTEPTFGENTPYPVIEKDKALAVRLAKQIIVTNPDLSLKVGRKALAQGFTENLLSLLRQLLRRNSQNGSILYRETIQKLREQKFTPNVTNPRDWQLFNFTFALADLKPPLVDELAYKDFMNMLLSAALANKCDKADPEGDISFFCSQIGTLVAQMEKVDPRRAGKLKHIESEEQDRPWGPEVYNELEDLAQARDYDGIFDLAKTYPGLKDTMYWCAFQVAQSSGDLERARKIANDYTDDAEVQQRMLSQLEPNKGESTPDERKLEEIQTEVDKITDRNERLAALIELSIKIGARDRVTALKLYDQISEQLQESKNPNERIQGQAFIAMLYCMEKSDRGFAMMESLMPKLNELIDSAVKLDGFDTNYMRDGEWNMSANGSLGRFLTELSQNSGYFAWCDFDRAVNLAAQFERTEIRMMAQLKLAQSILSGPPKRYPVRSYLN